MLSYSIISCKHSTQITSIYIWIEVYAGRLRNGARSDDFFFNQDMPLELKFLVSAL